jgi:hypothetical protein
MFLFTQPGVVLKVGANGCSPLLVRALDFLVRIYGGFKQENLLFGQPRYELTNF